LEISGKIIFRQRKKIFSPKKIIFRQKKNIFAQDFASQVPRPKIAHLLSNLNNGFLMISLRLGLQTTYSLSNLIVFIKEE